MSSISWLVSQKHCIQPASRTLMASCCPDQMVSGEVISRVAMAMTIGRRSVLMRKYGSYISARPCALVAVNTLPPAAAAPCTTLMALCSLSTCTMRESSLPPNTRSASPSTTELCGVMG